MVFVFGILTYYKSRSAEGCLCHQYPWRCQVEVEIRADGAEQTGFGQILFGQWWTRGTLALTRKHDIKSEHAVMEITHLAALLKVS